MKWEISELNSPTSLRRFGAPFKSEFGEVSPFDSELPILRYIFVHHVREFPFLDKANEKEFWQDKLQVVCSDGICPPGCKGRKDSDRAILAISSSNPSPPRIYHRQKTD